MPSGLPIGLTALLALASPPSAPGADKVAIRVEFDAPAGCSGADAFYAGLLSRMSRARRAHPGEEAIRLRVQLTRTGSRVRGELRLVEGPGEGDTRRVEGETCDAVVEVLSLTAALALAMQPAFAPPPPPPPEPPRGVRFELGLHAVAADVISNAFSFGGGLAARLERQEADGAGASVGLKLLYAQNDVVQTPDTVAVRWTALAATGCPGWSLGRIVTVQPCAQVIGGWLAASGRGLTNPSTVGRTWWSAGALLRVRARLGAGFSLELEGGASIPLVGRDFTTSTPERTVGGTPTISPMLALGLSRTL